MRKKLQYDVLVILRHKKACSIRKYSGYVVAGRRIVCSCKSAHRI
ncbi:hypothetical protein HMPREF3190_00874 [Umbribacter vaginalis]|nr:hypothetical protein HMPREF3190_00874 [Coriobacteriales bacterium DNF00809]